MSTLDAVPLAQAVADWVDARPTDLHLHRCPTGKFNTTWFVEGGPRPLVLRVAPPDDPGRYLFYEFCMMRQEPALHALLRQRTSAPVAEVVALDTSRRHIDRDFLLLERLPGLPVSDHPRLTHCRFEELLRAVGDCLRQVHAIQGDAYGYVGDHRPMDPQPDWLSAFTIMWNLLIADVERCGGYMPAEAAYLGRLLDRHHRVFDRPVPACLLHMDVWAQNLLADEQGQLSGLLDWDRALWGDPEIEFAVLDYCGISEPPFWEGYGAPRDRSAEAEVRRQFYLLYELQKYIFIRRVRSGDAGQADRYRRQVRELAQALG